MFNAYLGAEQTMRKNRRDQSPSPERPPSDKDTRSFEQPMGAPDGQNVPNRPNERLPHERDESAGATGDRLKENPVPSDRQISQANEDVEQGQVDTDRRGVPSEVPKSR
jgi:hypothetical protein